VGLIDGQDHFSNFKSTKSRAEVRSELDAARSQGLLSRGDADASTVMAPASGAHGVPGSRYSGRTREEVRAELDEYNRTLQDNPRGDIYRPN